MTATINVNLKPCYSYCQAASYPPREHETHCPAYPVPIPCPIPRSVAFEVVLSPGCYCERLGIGAEPHHVKDCPAKPIRVSCSISGKTWEESEVRDDVEAPPQMGIDRLRLYGACRERWALVKALVLGMDWKDINVGTVAMFSERDAVFSALADMARAEQSTWTAAESLVAALPRVYISPEMEVRGLEDRASARWLSAYVEHLIEQVAHVR